MLKRTFAAAALAMSVALTAPAFAAAPESDDPIIIVQNNWTSQLVLSTVVGKVLEGMGYTVEYRTVRLAASVQGNRRWRHALPGRSLGRLDENRFRKSRC